jgi:hypothetical protein
MQSGQLAGLALRHQARSRPSPSKWWVECPERCFADPRGPRGYPSPRSERAPGVEWSEPLHRVTRRLKVEIVLQKSDSCPRTSGGINPPGSAERTSPACPSTSARRVDTRTAISAKGGVRGTQCDSANFRSADCCLMLRKGGFPISAWECRSAKLCFAPFTGCFRWQVAALEAELRESVPNSVLERPGIGFLARALANASGW